MLEVILVAALAALVGAALCFVGYRVFMVMLPILGFFAGLWLGAEGIQLLFGGGFLATVSSWVVGFIIGLLLAVLSYLFYAVGVAIVAGIVGAAIGTGLMSAIGWSSGLVPVLVGIACAVIVVILVFVFNVQKYIIIVLTATVGANALVAAGLLLFGRITVDQIARAGTTIDPMLRDGWFWAIIWMGLALGGAFVQIRYNRDYEFSRERFQEGWG